MQDQIQEHMEVVGNDGEHVGVVDHVAEGLIKLTKNDAEAGGIHHLLNVNHVESVDGKVRLRVSADEAKASWVDA